MKVGKIELGHWIKPFGRPTPYRLALGIKFDGSHYAVQNGKYQQQTLIFINCGGPGKLWPEFCGELKFLQEFYQAKEFASYEEAMEYVDKFIAQIQRLRAFV